VRGGGCGFGFCVSGWVGNVLCFWYMEERGGDGLGWGCFLWTVLGGWGWALLGDCFGGRGWGGCLKGGVVVRRGSVWLWYWGGFVMGGGGMAMCGFLDRGLLGVEIRECRGGRGWVGGFGEEGGGGVGKVVD